MKNKGILYVISGPSGAGKGTICKAFMEKHTQDVRLSISATTRQPREGEIDGVNYFFLSEEAFTQKIAKEGFLEWACFCGNYYGTPKDTVLEWLEEGIDVILEIEVQGAMKVRDHFPEAVFVFVLPPSLQELRQRLTGRGTETEEVVEQRLQTALWECKNIKKYNYILINDTVEAAVTRLEAIMQAQKCVVARNNAFIQMFLSE